MSSLDRMQTTTLHGSCAARSGQGVLLLGASGAGKSDLLLRLVDRGFMLVADDRVIIEAGRASPPPELAGIIEVRGLGLLRLPFVARVALVLVMALDDAAFLSAGPPARDEAGDRRLPRPSRHRLLGVPMLRCAPFEASAALRIEIALDCLAGRQLLMVGALEADPPPVISPA